MEKRLNPLYRIGGIGILIAAAYAFASNVPGLLAFAIAGFGGWLVFRATSVADGLLATHRKAASAVAARIEQLQRTSPIVPLLQRRLEFLMLLTSTSNSYLPTVKSKLNTTSTGGSGNWTIIFRDFLFEARVFLRSARTILLNSHPMVSQPRLMQSGATFNKSMA